MQHTTRPRHSEATGLADDMPKHYIAASARKGLVGRGCVSAASERSEASSSLLDVAPSHLDDHKSECPVAHQGAATR